MTKIDLITGFLGSGKTTLLKKYLNHLLDLGERVCVLEFDYGAVNVDMMLLQEFNGRCDIEMVAGGCDYDCHQRRFKTKLISMGMKHYDRVIIEPSGVFNPIELFDVLNEEPLDCWYEIGSVISVVDSQNLELSPNILELLLSQLSYSGIVYLSKTQHLSDEDIFKIIDVITFKAKSNDVRLSKENFLIKKIDDLTADDFERIKKASYKEPIRNLGKTNYDSVFNSVYILNSNIDIDKLESISNKIFDDLSLGRVLRIKGFAHKDNKWFEFNKTKNESSINEIVCGQDVVIVIGENLNEMEINGLFL